MREVRGAVRRLIFNEYEASDAETCEDLAENLEEILLITSRRSDFTTQDLDEQVVALCNNLDLPLTKARLWRDLPDPDAQAEAPEPDPGPDAEPGWRGSG